jgi:hypothetical protein
MTHRSMLSKMEQIIAHLDDIKAMQDKYRGLETVDIDADILRRETIYRSEALDAIRELATMDIGENSQMAHVKFMAANKLMENGPAPISGGLDQTLRALDAKYHERAPRIKEIRERIVTFDGGQTIEADAGLPALSAAPVPE